MKTATLSNIPSQHMSSVLNYLFFKKALLFLYVFVSGLVWFEPSLYEALFIPMILVFVLISGVFTKTMLAPIFLTYLFLLGGYIGINLNYTVLELDIYDVSRSINIHILTTTYVLHTLILFMIVFYSDAKINLKIATNAYLFSAIFITIVSVLGYLNIIPIYDSITRFSRLIATFKDPNVYGPFLLYPMGWCLHKIFSGSFKDSAQYFLWMLILTIGVFLSFSRAAWGAAAAMILIFTCVYFLSYKTFKIRKNIILYSCLGLGVLILAILVLLSLDSISNLFEMRAKGVQDYDTGKYGRLERHWTGFMMLLDQPLGLGFFTFRKIFTEDTHNIYLYAFWSHGWLGGISYIMLIASTLFMSIKLLFKSFDLKPYFIVAFACFVPHAVEGWIIDTHHWRHLYFIMGMLWAFIALDKSGKLYVK